MKTYIIIILSLLIVSCKTVEQQTGMSKRELRKHIKHDKKCQKMFERYACFTPPLTIEKIVTVYKDTTFNITFESESDKDTVKIEIVKGLMFAPISILKTKYAFSKAWVDNGKMHHEIEQIKHDVPVTIHNAIQSTIGTKDTIVYKTVYKTKNVMYVPTLIKILAAVGLLSVILFALFLYLKLYKRKK